MNDIDKFKKVACDNGMCDDYQRIWLQCHSHKNYMDMALGVKAIDFLCNSYAKGWGADKKIFHRRFPEFINGRYISEQKGYNTKMYIDYNGEVKTDTTAIMIIDSNVDVITDEIDVCELFIAGKCKVNLNGVGKLKIVCYGNPKDIVIGGENTNYKRINKI